MGAWPSGNSDQQPNDPSQNRNFSFIDNLTWIKGRHQLKFGGRFPVLSVRQFRRDGERRALAEPLNSVLCRRRTSVLPILPIRETGGRACCWVRYSPRQRLIPAPLRRMRGEYYAWYVEDVFKVTASLQLRSDFRHEIPTVIREADSRQSRLNLSLPNPGAGGRLGALQFLQPRRTTDTDFKRPFRPE